MRAVVANCGRPVPEGGPGPGANPAVLSGLRLKPARFHVGGRKAGTNVLFRLDRASAVSLRFDRLLAGHKKGKRCSTKVHKGRRCTVAKRVGDISLAARGLHAGSNTVKFSGRIGKRALKPGAIADGDAIARHGPHGSLRRREGAEGNQASKPLIDASAAPRRRASRAARRPGLARGRKRGGPAGRCDRGHLRHAGSAFVAADAGRQRVGARSGCERGRHEVRLHVAV